MAIVILITPGPDGPGFLIREDFMKYKEIKKGRNKGLWEDENGIVYTEKVAKKRIANPELYDPFDNVLANRAPKKAKK